MTFSSWVEVGQLTFREWGWVEVEFQLPGTWTRVEAGLRPSGNSLVAFGPGTLADTTHSRYHQAGAILIHRKAVRFTEMVFAHSSDAMRAWL